MKFNHYWILIAVLLACAVIPNASATFSFSDYKQYNDGTIGIWKGNVIMPDSKMADYKLIENTEYCIKSCYAVIETTLYQEGSLIDSIKFTDLSKKYGKDVSYRYKLLEEEIYDAEIPDYKESCIEEKNGTICQNIAAGSHKETETRWIEKDYNGEILQPGTYRWKIEGIKQPYDNVDWIMKTDLGKQELSEWATWTSGLNANLTLYLKMGDNNDSVTGRYNMSVQPTYAQSPFSNGIIGNGANFSTAWVMNISNSQQLGFDHKNVTMNFWVFINQTGSQMDFVNRYAGGGAGMYFMQDSTTNTQLSWASGHTLNGNPIPAGKWYMVTLRRNDTAYSIWLNGTIDAQANDATNEASGLNIILGGHNGGVTDLNGMMDEFGYWNRSLSDSEISDLYNAGAGITYSLNAISVTLNSPIDNAIISNPSLFNCSATGIAQLNNISLWTNATGTLAMTNYSSISGNSNQSAFSLSVSNNYTLWTCQACDINGVCAFGNNRTVSPDTYHFNFGLCNSSMKMIYYNLTFKDESSGNRLNATIDLSTWNFWLTGNSNVNKTYLFSNLTHNAEYDFCSELNYSSITANVNIQYSSAQTVTYPQRSYQTSNLLMTNASTSKTLYLLPSSSGQYVTFQVINTALQPIEGVQVTATRNIGGTDYLVEYKITDASGGATLWLDPLYAHTLTFSKSGYVTFSSSITPSQTSYTISLTQIGGTNGTVVDYTSGLMYSIGPSNNELIGGNTYNFNLTVASPNNFDSFGFFIKNSTGSIINSSYSTNSGGGTIAQTYKVIDKNYIIVYGNWTINGQKFTATKAYSIVNYTSSNYSIDYFFNDLKIYTASGLFGLDSFGLTIIIFLLIFITTGIMSYNFGIYSPAAISGIIFGMTAFFDAGLGLIATPINAVPHFPTVFMGIIFVALIAKEATTY